MSEPGTQDQPTVEPGLTRPGAAPAEPPAWLRGLLAALFLYLFLCAINVMGGGLKMMARAPDTSALIEELFALAENPFVALMSGVLVTAIVQSSSFTTSMIIAMAASGTLDMHAAVFAVMGANIGTSVTGILVSMANIRIRRQFRRAFTAALVHDVFNLLTVGIVFPLEWAFSPLARTAGAVARGMGLETEGKPHSPIKLITEPVVGAFQWAAELVFSNAAWVGLTMAVGGLALLFMSLVMMVGNLKGALLRYIERLFRSFFFRNDFLAAVVGTVTTVLVQSSSVSVGLIVPLAGAGAVQLARVFPFVLGANVGTTVTGLIAAAAVVDDPGGVNEKGIAVTVALCHVMFNIVGIAVWYPLRSVPLAIAGWYGHLAAESKRYAFLFLLGVFVVIPVVGILVTEWVLMAPSPSP